MDRCILPEYLHRADFFITNEPDESDLASTDLGPGLNSAAGMGSGCNSRRETFPNHLIAQRGGGSLQRSA